MSNQTSTLNRREHRIQINKHMSKWNHVNIQFKPDQNIRLNTQILKQSDQQKKAQKIVKRTRSKPWTTNSNTSNKKTHVNNQTQQIKTNNNSGQTTSDQTNQTTKPDRKNMNIQSTKPNQKQIKKTKQLQINQIARVRSANHTNMLGHKKADKNHLRKYGRP